MGTAYRKTAKGLAEIDTRVHRLPPRMRSALILADGRRSLTELAALIGDSAPALLDQLLAGGFIEPVTAASSATSPAAAAAPQARASAAAAPEPAAVAAGHASTLSGTDEADALRQLPQRRREAARAVLDRIGPLGEGLAMRIERSRTPQQFREAVEAAARMVGHQLGASAGEAMAAKLLADWP